MDVVYEYARYECICAYKYVYLIVQRLALDRCSVLLFGVLECRRQGGQCQLDDGERTEHDRVVSISSRIFILVTQRLVPMLSSFSLSPFRTA